MPRLEPLILLFGTAISVSLAIFPDQKIFLFQRVKQIVALNWSPNIKFRAGLYNLHPPQSSAWTPEMQLERDKCDNCRRKRY